jgi:hypothetical protein
MQIIKVDPALYKGDLKVLAASNPLDEQVTLRHSGDYAGNPELYEFQWRYGFPTNGTNPTITSGNINTAASTSTWLKPSGNLPGSILVGGSPSATISSPAVLMGDTYFTMNYRLKVDGQADDAGWSGWTSPALVEGWIKRVLAKITDERSLQQRDQYRCLDAHPGRQTLGGRHRAEFEQHQRCRLDRDL